MPGRFRWKKSQVLIEDGNATYDWKQKAVFKLSVDELLGILMVLQEKREKCSFVRDPANAGSENGGIENLFVEWKSYSKNGGEVRGVLLTIKLSEKSLAVGLAENEIITFRASISSAMPKIYGW